MTTRIRGTLLAAVALALTASVQAQVVEGENAAGVRLTSASPTTSVSNLTPNHCYGAGGSLEVYDVVFGVDNYFAFNTALSWYGATDGDNSTEFFATPAGGSLHRINPGAGTATAVGSFGSVAMRELGYDEANDLLYGTDYDFLYIIDTTTGIPAVVGPMADGTGYAPGSFWAMDYHAGLGKLFAVSQTTFSMYEVNTATGQLTLVGATGTDRICDLWYDAASDTFYANANVPDRHFTIDPLTGAATLTATLSSGNILGLGDVSGCGVSATCNWYCGTGVNIPCDGFVVTNPPQLGGFFTAQVSHVCGGSVAGIIGFASPASLMTPWGEVLVNIADPGGELLALPPAFGDPGTWNVPVPNNPAFCGLRFFAQAYGAPPINLHCAWECVVGI